MRRFCASVRTWCLLSAVGAAVLFVLLLYRSPAFQMGTRYEFWFGANSSALSAESECPVLEKLRCGAVAGESVLYEGDRAEELISRYRAVLLFCEETGDTVNYYCYSPLLGGCAEVCGRSVNLHIAVGRGQTAAGTPLVFGGF